MSNFRSSTTIFRADAAHREMIASFTSFIGWSDAEAGREGIARQASMINEFAKDPKASGVIVLFNESTGEILASVPFGTAARVSNRMAEVA